LPLQELAGLAKTGARHLQTYRSLLEHIEADYGVPGNVVIAIWGRETDYGAEVQRHPVFQAPLANSVWVAGYKPSRSVTDLVG
jgi:membrane-bound lytic murein transglycosylase B